jgi:hypothetical protein
MEEDQASYVPEKCQAAHYIGTEPRQMQPYIRTRGPGSHIVANVTYSAATCLRGG